mmetsp:Transcript_644/g.1390  ORF Transcript_644/g.1390 Transcript_644/m.1390 type:complete len:239 (-) Transcript_644:262-978(-)
MRPAAACRTLLATASASGRKFSTTSMVPSPPPLSGVNDACAKSSSIAATLAAALVKSLKSTTLFKSNPLPACSTFLASNCNLKIIFKVALNSSTRDKRVVADSMRVTPRCNVDSTRLATVSRSWDWRWSRSALSRVTVRVTKLVLPLLLPPSLSSLSVLLANSNPCNLNSGPATSSGASLDILCDRLSTSANLRSTSASASVARCRYSPLEVIHPALPLEEEDPALAVEELSWSKAAA